MRRFVRGIIAGLIIVPLGIGLVSWWRNRDVTIRIPIF